MKIFQIQNDICYWETPFQSLEEAEFFCPKDVSFVEAPDFIFEGWGYRNGVFIKPTPPKGWLYDDETGTFYLVDELSTYKTGFGPSIRGESNDL